ATCSESYDGKSETQGRKMGALGVCAKQRGEKMKSVDPSGGQGPSLFPLRHGRDGTIGERSDAVLRTAMAGNDEREKGSGEAATNQLAPEAQRFPFAFGDLLADAEIERQDLDAVGRGHAVVGELIPFPFAAKGAAAPADLVVGLLRFGTR